VGNSYSLYERFLGNWYSEGYGLDGRGVGVWVLVGSRIFSTSSRPGLRPTQPPIWCVPRALSPRVKRPGQEADHSPPSSAEVKHDGAVPPLISYVFMEQCLIDCAQGQLYLFTSRCVNIFVRAETACTLTIVRTWNPATWFSLVCLSGPWQRRNRFLALRLLLELSCYL
jgi:hypothetical protein